MLLAGLDAGQTSTRCRVSQWTGSQWLTVGEGTGPGVSHLAASGGIERFQQAVRSSVRTALAASHGDALAADQSGVGVIDAVVIGASGIEQGTPLQDQASALLADALAIAPHQALATGDERTALRGAFPDGAGIVVISGTGTICVGRDGSGLEHRCGGWGWRLDGAGAAFDLGHHALQLSLRMADGRLPDHPLRRTLWQALGCHSSVDVKARVVQPDFGPADFAALAPLVDTAASEGLEDAQRILDRSAEALVEMISAVVTALQLTDPAVVPHGGALLHLPLFRATVNQRLAEQMPRAQWCTAAGDACDGALLLARDLMIRPR